MTTTDEWREENKEERERERKLFSSSWSREPEGQKLCKSSEWKTLVLGPIQQKGFPVIYT